MKTLYARIHGYLSVLVLEDEVADKILAEGLYKEAKEDEKH